jgi:polyadenylate-binding protein 2
MRLWESMMEPIVKDPVDDTDERSVFVKNVDFSAEPAELKDHFKECGEIKRVTILMDKMSGQPKG